MNPYQKILSVMAAGAVLFSCQDHAIAPESKTTKGGESIEKSTYVYQGVNYDVHFKKEGDQQKAIRDANYDIIEKALEQETSGMFIDAQHPDVIYLFDDEKDCDVFLKGRYKSDVKANTDIKKSGTGSRTNTYETYMALYRHKDFNVIDWNNDLFFVQPAGAVNAGYDPGDGTYYPHSGKYGLDIPPYINDAISSFHIANGTPHNLTVRFHEHHNGGGHYLTIGNIAGTYPNESTEYKRFDLDGDDWSSRRWTNCNDKFSSISWWWH
jgi:hypothetical protein